MLINEDPNRPPIKKIQLRVLVDDIRLSARDWELFCDMPGANKAARAINSAFMEAVNDGCNQDEVREAVFAVMSEHSSLGAQDTEPRATLEDLLDMVFGTETGSYF